MRDKVYSCMDYDYDLTIKRFVSNEDYIKWLEGFTNKEKYFSTSCFADYYQDKSYGAEDMYNLLCLREFYLGIKKYADKKNIEPFVTDDVISFYLVEYNGTEYQIGSIAQFINESFYCKKEDSKNSKYVIKFEDIMNDALNKNMVNVKKKSRRK